MYVHIFRRTHNRHRHRHKGREVRDATQPPGCPCLGLGSRKGLSMPPKRSCPLSFLPPKPPPVTQPSSGKSGMEGIITSCRSLQSASCRGTFCTTAEEKIREDTRHTTGWHTHKVVHTPRRRGTHPGKEEAFSKSTSRLRPSSRFRWQS